MHVILLFFCVVVFVILGGVFLAVLSFTNTKQYPDITEEQILNAFFIMTMTGSLLITDSVIFLYLIIGNY